MRIENENFWTGGGGAYLLRGVLFEHKGNLVLEILLNIKKFGGFIEAGHILEMPYFFDNCFKNFS